MVVLLKKCKCIVGENPTIHFMLFDFFRQKRHFDNLSLRSKSSRV